LSCPRCAGRDVGRIAPDHYYCWTCFCEFARQDGQWQVFEVDAEGTLLPVDVPAGPGGASDGGPGSSDAAPGSLAARGVPNA
jgi:hypothetical protein